MTVVGVQGLVSQVLSMNVWTPPRPPGVTAGDCVSTSAVVGR